MPEDIPTIANSTPEHLMSWLWCEFLKHPDSTQFGVPNPANMPIRKLNPHVKTVYPSIVIAAREKNSVGARREIDLSAVLLTWVKPADPKAAQNAKQTSDPEATRIITAVDSRIRQLRTQEVMTPTGTATLIGWFDWLATCPESQRNGWRSLRLVYRGCDPIHYNEEQHCMSYSASWTMFLVV